MGRFINPFTDAGFKRIFGQELSKPILIGFLNAMLKGEHTIEDLTFLDKEQLGIYSRDRALIYDVYCRTSTGEHIIVEMQNRFQPYFKERTIYYAARAIVRQGERGREWDYDVKAVYLVAFMDFILSDHKGDFRIDVALMDMKQRTLFSDKVRLIYLQLPNFNKQEDDCTDTFDRMIYVFKHMDIFERMPWAAKDAVFQRLSEIAEVAALTPEERISYESDVQNYRDAAAVMKGQYILGHAEGMAEGLAEGEAKGRAMERLDNARRLLANGIPRDIVVQSLSLTEEEQQQL